MKTAYFFTLALVVLASSVSAQTLEQPKSLKPDEVPVIIQQSLQKDFSTLIGKGECQLKYSQDIITKQLTPNSTNTPVRTMATGCNCFSNPSSCWSPSALACPCRAVGR